MTKRVFFIWQGRRNIRAFHSSTFRPIKNPPFGGVLLAGAEGIEPSSGVLETLILPMNYAPTLVLTLLIIAQPSKDSQLYNANF